MELKEIGRTDFRVAIASLARATARLCTSFAVWWLRGLWLGLPKPLRERWFVARDELLLRLTDDELVVERNPQPTPFATSDADSSTPRERVAALALTLVEKQPQALFDAVGATASTATIAVALPDSVCLTRRLVLPLAAEANLSAVLYHEIDRLTPFDVRQCTFAHVVRTRDASAGRLIVELALVDKDALERCLGPIRSAGLAPQIVTAANEDGELLPLNLLAGARRRRLPSLKTPLRPALVAAAFLLALTALYLPLLRYQNLSRYLEAATEQQRTLAVKARGALASTEALAAGSDYLATVRRGYVRPVDVVLELTTALPNDTWLTRLIVTRDGVQMQGESTQTSAVLEIVEQMEALSGARFQSPVSLSLMTGNEQFVIAADYGERP
jgi:general secretion pathway protein L